MPERDRGCKTTPASSILCLFQIRGKYSVMQDLSSRFRFKLFNSVLLVFSIRPQVSPLPPAKLSDEHPLGELWQRDGINIIGLKQWYRQKNTDFKSYLLIKMQSIFKIQSHFLGKCIKAPTEKCTFPTTTKYTWFFIFIVSDSVFIYFRDSTYNFRLWHLIRLYNRNLKLDLISTCIITISNKDMCVSTTFNTNTFRSN